MFHDVNRMAASEPVWLERIRKYRWRPLCCMSASGHVTNAATMTVISEKWTAYIADVSTIEEEQ